jgi:proteasome lid subunit RPN8/RPN11
MRLKISSTLLAQLVAESAASANEVCGLLFGTGEEVVHAVKCANVAADPATTFEIDPAALIAAHKAARAGGPGLVGHYHSHPSGLAEPSVRDAEGAMGDGALWLILAKGGARLWRSLTAGAFEEVVIDAG